MLARAFIETADFRAAFPRALAQTDDFNFVVGRRGTGKSALFTKLREHFSEHNHITLVSITPGEHETMEFQRVLEHCGSNYRHLRALSRLVWRAHLLITATKAAATHYRASKSTAHDFLVRYLEAHGSITEMSGADQCNAILKFGALHAGSDPQAIEQLERLLFPTVPKSQRADTLSDSLSVRKRAG
jgi:hypothetical protein